MKLIIDINTEVLVAFAALVGMPKSSREGMKSFLAETDTIEVDSESVEDKKLKLGIAQLGLYFLLTESKKK